MRRRGFGESPVNSDDWSTKFEEEHIVRPTESVASVGDPVPAMQSAGSMSGYGNSGSAPEQNVYSVGRGYSMEPAPAAERPMVFALREHRDVYVYEYSDRLEYYKHTSEGMVKCNTEYKRR